MGFTAKHQDGEKYWHATTRAEGLRIDKEARTASFVFATENPTILRYDWDIGEYYEVLSCTPEAADLSRLTSGGAFLREHDRDQQIGVHLSATMDADRKGRATVKFSRSALGEQEFQDVQDGIRSNISVSYQPLSMVLQRTGSDTEPPTYLVDKWQALENSLVSVPADVNCRVGRAAYESATPPPTDAPRCKITVPDNLRQQHEQTMIRRNRSLKFNAPDNGGGSGGGAATLELVPAMTPEARAQIVKEGQEAERKRCNDIEGYVAFFQRGGVNIRAAADQFKKDGKSAEELRAHVMSDAFKAEPIDTHVEIVNEPTPGQRQPARGLSVGSQFVQTREFKALNGRSHRNTTIALDVPDATMLGARGKASLSARQRAGFAEDGKLESFAYDGIYLDALKVIYLCTCPNSDTLLAARRPDAVIEKVLAWADEQNVLMDDPELLACFASIIGQLAASASEPAPQKDQASGAASGNG